MSARAIWKGVLRFDSDAVPVKLYSAVQDRAVHFNLLEDREGSRVHQQMVNPESNEPVAAESIQKAYEAEPGVFVPLTKDDLESLEPAPSRDMVPLRFIRPEAIGRQWYARSYYLGPDGVAEPYFALAYALENERYAGLLRWVMRKKMYFGALTANHGLLTLNTLHYAGEVVSPKQLPVPGGPALDKKEIAMARQLVSMLEGQFDPAEFHDEYRDRLMALIEAKAKGQKPKLQAVAMKKEPPSLTKALEASLKALKGGKRVA